MSSSINQTLENYSSEEIDDVLIVGGGPVGLFLANAIKRFHPDASIRIIEKAPSNSIHSKALGIHARSMECLSYLGNVLDEFKEKSVLAPHLSVRYGTTGNEIMKINFKQADTPFNYMTLIPQYLTEDILSSALDKLGVSIEREMEFRSFMKKENDLVITEVLNCQTNQTEVIKSRFVLGCDGGHSPIRQALGFPFKGNTRSEVFLMGDVEIEELEWLSKEPCIFSGIKGSLIYIPFSPNSNICRFLIDIDANDPILQINQAENGINKHLSDNIRYPLEIYQDYIQKRLPQKIVMKNPAWITSFKVQERLSSHYREGNIILLGDAAHVHSPFGGQGMNLGFQDAFNLSWKLGLILRNKGQNKEKILESYEEERRPIADETIETTKQVGLMFGSAAGWFSRMLREYIIYPIVSWIAPVIPTGLFENIMQLRVQYKNSSIIPITQNGVNSVIQPGYRAPTKGSFKSIIDPNMPSKTPLQCYTETTKHLLFLYLNKGDSSNLLNYETIISLLKDQFRDEIEMHIVWKHDDDQLHERTNNLWEGQWKDSTDETFNNFNFNQSAIVVVRPDGVIGLITSPTDKQSLLNYFNMFLL